MIYSIYSSKELLKFLYKHKKVVIECFTEWCGPCKKISPVFEKLSIEYPHILFVKINIELFENMDQIKPFQSISSIPTFLFYLNSNYLSNLTFSGVKHSILEQNIYKLDCI